MVAGFAPELAPTDRRPIGSPSDSRPEDCRAAPACDLHWITDPAERRAFSSNPRAWAARIAYRLVGRRQHEGQITTLRARARARRRPRLSSPPNPPHQGILPDLALGDRLETRRAKGDCHPKAQPPVSQGEDLSAFQMVARWLVTAVTTGTSPEPLVATSRSADEN